MKRLTHLKRLTSCLVLSLLFASEAIPNEAFARGGFGGFRGGGGGFGGFRGGGFSGGGFDRGGFGGGGFGGYRGGGFGGGFDRGGFGGGGFGNIGYHGGDFGGGSIGGFRGGEGEGGFGQRQSIGYRGGDAGGFDNSVRNTGSWGGDAGRWGNGDAVNRGQLNSFLGLPTDGGLGAASGAIANRGGSFANHPIDDQAAGAYGTHPYSQTWAHANGHNVQNWADNHPNATSAWNSARNWAWTPDGVDAGLWAASAWDAAAWPTVDNWLGWGNTSYYPYDYGQYITYDGDSVYYGSQPAATAQQYYQEASDLAATAPAAPANSNSQWLPLGVFGLVQGDSTTPTITFQLAVNKEGTIRGNSSNQYADVLPVQGAVNKRTQRVCWTVGTDKTTVYDTGLVNLTKSESPILVHSGPKITQQEMLVRLKHPNGQSGNGTAGSTN
jgi:hypothetical protein